MNIIAVLGRAASRGACPFSSDPVPPVLLSPVSQSGPSTLSTYLSDIRLPRSKSLFLFPVLLPPALQQGSPSHANISVGLVRSDGRAYPARAPQVVRRIPVSESTEAEIEGEAGAELVAGQVHHPHRCDPRLPDRQGPNPKSKGGGWGFVLRRAVAHAFHENGQGGRTAFLRQCEDGRASMKSVAARYLDGATRTDLRDLEILSAGKPPYQAGYRYGFCLHCTVALRLQSVRVRAAGAFRAIHAPGPSTRHARCPLPGRPPTGP